VLVMLGHAMKMREKQAADEGEPEQAASLRA
jgi:hypothetical protein